MHEDIREEVKHEDPKLEILKEIRGEKNNDIGEEKQVDLKVEFLNKGFVFPIDVFSTEEAEYIKSKYYEYVDKYGSGSGSDRRIRGNKLFRVHVLAPWAAQLVRHPKLLSVVSSLLDSKNILIWSSDLAVKSPSSSECYGWHQDEAYADLGPHHKLISAWISFGHVGKENGCVRFLRGSHLMGTLPHVSGIRTEDRNLVLGQVVAEDFLPDTLDQDETCVCLEPGQVSLHAWRTIHSSHPNTSNNDRVLQFVS